VHLIVMAKSPRPGSVKTRLCPPCTPEQAADLATAALVDTLEAGRSSAADQVVLALAGEPGDWLPAGVRVIPQRGDGFDQRLTNAWSDVGGPAFQIGMDTPQLDPTLLDDAMARLDEPDLDAVIGLADDGGWWGLGLRKSDERVFLGVPMSCDHTGMSQVARLDDLGLRTGRLANLTDVDTIADAAAVATLAPNTRFASLVRELGLTSGPSLIADDGTTIRLRTERFCGAPSDTELAQLDATEGPVIDLGCGPGRLVLALAERGEVVLGVDTSPTALSHARRVGAPVLERSVFDRIPGEGRYRTALLFDGNIGIGGDPVALLRRVAALLAPGGRALVEVEPPGVSSRHLTVRLHAGGEPSRPFPWAVVGRDGLASLADMAGFGVDRLVESDGRHFAWLVRR